MKKRLCSLAILCVFLTTSLLAGSHAAGVSPQFEGRGAETISSSDVDGSVSATTSAVGGGVRSLTPFTADSINLDFLFNAVTLDDIPQNQTYILSFTDLKETTPNQTTDQARGVYFHFSFNGPNTGLDALILNSMAYSALKDEDGEFLGSGSKYFQRAKANSFSLVKNASGKYDFVIINDFYRASDMNTDGKILIANLDIAHLLSARGLYINFYLADAAGQAIDDNYTMKISGAKPSDDINGLLPRSGATLEASENTGVNIKDPKAGHGVYTEKRVKLDGLNITFGYTGTFGLLNGYALGFSNKQNANILDPDERQKGFGFVFRYYSDLGAQDPNGNTAGTLIDKNFKRALDGPFVTFSDAEITEEFAYGRFMDSGDTATLHFEKIGTDGALYKMTYTNTNVDITEKVLIAGVDLSACLDADGSVYISYYLADMVNPDAAGFAMQFNVDGEYTDNEAEVMPPPVEEGELKELKPINGFVFTPNEVRNADVTALSHNGLSLTGRTDRIAATYDTAISADGLEFTLETKSGWPANANYSVSLAKEKKVLEHNAGTAEDGLVITVQMGAGNIFYIYAWKGDQPIVGVSKNFEDGKPCYFRLVKEADGYSLLFKSNELASYEPIFESEDLSKQINSDDQVFFSVKVDGTNNNTLDYNLAVPSLPIPKAAAQAKIDETSGFTQADFDPDTWADFAQARDVLQKAIDDNEPYLNDLYKTFLNALVNLRSLSDIEIAYKELAAKIDAELVKADSLAQNAYTQESWKAFMEARAALEEWYNDGGGYDTLKSLFDEFLKDKAALAAVDGKQPEEDPLSKAPDTGVAALGFNVAGMAALLVGITRKKKK